MRRFYCGLVTANTGPFRAHLGEPTYIRLAVMLPKIAGTWCSCWRIAPVKTSYMVEFQVCLADIDGRRVRVEDAGFEKVFYQYEDDQIFRVENVDLLGNHVPQLLVVTGSSGTNDRVTLHVIGEVNGQLREWTWPAYDTSSGEAIARRRGPLLQRMELPLARSRGHSCRRDSAGEKARNGNCSQPAVVSLFGSCLSKMDSKSRVSNVSAYRLLPLGIRTVIFAVHPD